MHDQLHGNGKGLPVPSVALFRVMAEQAGATILSSPAGDIVRLLQQLTENDLTIRITSDLQKHFPELVQLERAAGDWHHTTVSRAIAGLAATGSVLLGERDHGDRLLTLLCRRHIVLVPASSIREQYSDIAISIQNLIVSGACGYATLVTGPSRTADIEQSLTTGVHGPHELVVLLLEDWAPYV